MPVSPEAGGAEWHWPLHLVAGAQSPLLQKHITAQQIVRDRSLSLRADSASLNEAQLSHLIIIGEASISLSWTVTNARRGSTRLGLTFFCGEGAGR